jgi:glycosyltransferase involved in cell wall biosynthesis
MTSRDVSHGAQLRVLQVIQDLTYGGAERVVATLSSRLRAEGAHVSVVSAGDGVPGLPDVAVAPLPQIERRIDRIPAAVLAVRHAVKRERPHVIHAHNPAMALVTALATARGHTTPALVTVHGVPEEDYRSAARVLRLAGLGVIACGPGVAAALGEHGVRVAGTVVNGVRRVASHGSRDELKQSFELDPELRLAVAVGRLAPQKNQALALHVVAAVPDAALLVVGEGPLREELAALADSLGIGDRVRFAGGRSDAPELIASADVLLLTSRWEGLPLVVLEALASGTPVVATAARGVRELVHDEETALLAPLDDIDALASGLRRALGDEALAARLRDNGLRLAERYGEEEMGDRYLALYRSLARR